MIHDRRITLVASCLHPQSHLQCRIPTPSLLKPKLCPLMANLATIHLADWEFSKWAPPYLSKPWVGLSAQDACVWRGKTWIEHIWNGNDVWKRSGELNWAPAKRVIELDYIISLFELLSETDLMRVTWNELTSLGPQLLIHSFIRKWIFSVERNTRKTQSEYAAWPVWNPVNVKLFFDSFDVSAEFSFFDMLSHAVRNIVELSPDIPSDC